MKKLLYYYTVFSFIFSCFSSCADTNRINSKDSVMKDFENLSIERNELISNYKDTFYGSLYGETLSSDETKVKVEEQKKLLDNLKKFSENFRQSVLNYKLVLKDRRIKMPSSKKAVCQKFSAEIIPAVDMLSGNEKLVSKNFKQIDNIKDTQKVEKLIENNEDILNDSCDIIDKNIGKFKDCGLEILNYSRRYSELFD